MIGIIPAAGQASRMGGFPKMLLPVPAGPLITTLMVRMATAGTGRWWVGTSKTTYPMLAKLIPEVYMVTTKTMSETVLRAQKSAKDDVVAFGMPDSYFDDWAAFNKLNHAIQDGADVAVGLFLARDEQSSKLGMCDFDPKTQQIMQVVDKPVGKTPLAWAWGVLAWKPAFWDCIKASDPHVGFAIPRAIEAGLDVRAVKMDGEYFDAGTPDEYFALIRHLTTDKVMA